MDNRRSKLIPKEAKTITLEVPQEISHQKSAEDPAILGQVTENLMAINALKDRLPNAPLAVQIKIDKNFSAINKLVDRKQYTQALYLAESFLTQLRQKELFESQMETLKNRLEVQRRLGQKLSTSELDTLTEMIQESRRLDRNGEYEEALKKINSALNKAGEFAYNKLEQTQELPVQKFTPAPKTEILPTSAEPSFLSRFFKRKSTEQKQAETLEKQKNEWLFAIPKMDRAKVIANIKKFNIDLNSEGKMTQTELQKASVLLREQSVRGEIFQALYNRFMHLRMEEKKRTREASTPKRQPAWSEIANEERIEREAVTKIQTMGELRKRLAEQMGITMNTDGKITDKKSVERIQEIEQWRQMMEESINSQAVSHDALLLDAFLKHRDKLIAKHSTPETKIAKVSTSVPQARQREQRAAR